MQDAKKRFLDIYKKIKLIITSWTTQIHFVVYVWAGVCVCVHDRTKWLRILYSS